MLPLLTLLARLVFTVALLFAERVVEQLLLFADDVPELVHHLHHLLALLTLTLALLCHAAVLELLEHVAQLTQHLLGHFARALSRHVFDIAHHPLEVLLANDLIVLAHLRRGRLAFRLPRELLHHLVEGLAQLVHELANFFFRGAVAQGLSKLFLSFAQRAFRIRQIAVFEAQRDVPEVVGGTLHRGPRLVALQPPEDRAQTEIGAPVSEELIGLEGDRFETLQDVLSIAGVLDQ